MKAPKLRGKEEFFGGFWGQGSLDLAKGQ